MARGNRSRGRRDSGEATTQVDDRATAVEQAAAATVADDAPEVVASADDTIATATATATQIDTAREIDGEFAGQDLEISEEQQAEFIPGPKADDTDELLGIPGLDDLKNRKPDDDLLGTDGDPNAPPDDPRQAAEDSKAFNPFGTAPETLIEAPDARDAGIFDLIQDPGADGDPLSSFLDAAEAKLGRSLSATTPSDQTNDSVTGTPSVADEPAPPDSLFNASTTAGAVAQGLRSTLGASFIFAPAVVAADTVARVLEAKDAFNQTQKSGGVKDPGPDGEGADIPEEFRRQLDSEVARLRALKPETGDGVTDPAESDVEVIDPSAALQTHAEQGRELFGQPDETAPSGSDANFNPGADPTGAGVITPSEDKDVTPGRTRNDDPFADAGTAPERGTASNDAAADFQSFLPSETTGTAIDAVPDLTRVQESVDPSDRNSGSIEPVPDGPPPGGAPSNDDPFADLSVAPVASSKDPTDDSQSFLPSETSGTAVDDRPDVPDPISDPA